MSEFAFLVLILLIGATTLASIVFWASGVFSSPAAQRLASAFASGAPKPWLALYCFLVTGILLLPGLHVVEPRALLIVVPAFAIALVAATGILLLVARQVVRPAESRPASRVSAGFRITREGAYWLLVAAVLFTAGWWKGLNVILMLSFLMLLIWLLNFFQAGYQLNRLKGQRHITGPIFAGTPFPLELELTNEAAKEQVGLRLVDSGPDHRLNFFAVRLEAGDTARFVEQVVRPRRCRYALEPLRVVNGYPFGLVERSRPISPGEDLVVLPRLGKVYRRKLRRFLDHSAFDGSRPRRSPRAQLLVATELHGVRPYQHGDSPRSIHWRTTARRGELMVREFEEGSDDNLILVLDPWHPAAEFDTEKTFSEELLEDAVSLAATICWEWCRQNAARFTLIVARPAPVVLDGFTSRDYGLRMLEQLAVTPGYSERSEDALGEALPRPASLAPGPIVVVGVRPESLAQTLGKRWRRRTVPLSATDIDRYDFYERPASS
jgi:uncharacterized protein (DUF58 family)